MKPYDELTFRGQILRLRKLCIKALENYPIEVARVRYLTTDSTTMFRVDARDGQKYVIRLYSEMDSSLAENETEMFWLSALTRDTDLHVTEPVPRSDGGYLTFVSVAGVPGEKRCALYRWVPGVQLEEYVSLRSYRQLGVIMAKLHEHAGSLRLPADLHPKRWDKVFYYPGETAVYNRPEYSHLYTPAQVQIMARACKQADAFLAGLYRDKGEPMLVHGDLHFWNVHIFRGQLYVIDFEDVLLGFDLQDIAICLYYLRNRSDYPELAAAFQAGYATVRAWPSLSDDDLHTLWIARMANFANYASQAFDSDESAREFIGARCDEMQGVLR